MYTAFSGRDFSFGPKEKEEELKCEAFGYIRWIWRIAHKSRIKTVENVNYDEYESYETF
jgi:hypothetical protein